MNDRFVAKRLMHIVLMLIGTLFVTIFLGRIHDRFFDELSVFLVVDLIFFALFLFVLEHYRMQRCIAGNRETTFQKITAGYFFSLAMIFAGAFFPEFLKPVILIPLFMAAVGTQVVAMYTGIFLTAVLALVLGTGIQEFTLCVLMVLFGCMIAEAAGNGRLKLWYQISVFCVTAILPVLFYYLTYREVKTRPLLLGAAEGFAVVWFLFFIYPKIAVARDSEIADTLDDILDDSYPLSRELYSFSKADYNHARRVSKIAAKCAKLVDADEKVCAAAGFYYRIGVLEGASITENGIKLAQRECFPEDVIRIISEYNGNDALPSDIESAIVHMVDGLIKKLEVFDSTTMSSEWNQDMVIYQTLNDFSAKGIYDRSGLTMNMFLKIREYLVNEEALL